MAVGFQFHLQSHFHRSMEIITRPDQVELHAFISKGNEGKPGLVIVQEWWGMNEQMKNRALQFEAFGFRTVLPDLYRGRSTKIGNVDEARHLRDGLDFEDACKDIQACVDYLKSTGSTKVGVTGYCMGAALALAAASVCTGIEAIVPFYGLAPPPFDMTKITIPVQGHFAEHDDWCTLPLVDELDKQLKCDHEIIIYPGTKHAFTNEERPDKYDEQASKLSMERTIAFFQKHLA